MPAVFGGRFGESPVTRTLAELARSGASKQVGAVAGELAELKGLSQPALAKITGQLPTKAMEAATGVYQQLYSGLLDLAAQYGLTPPAQAGTSTSVSKGSGGGGFSIGTNLGSAADIKKALGID